MKYRIEIKSTDGIKQIYSDFNETEGVRGDIAVAFELHGVTRDWIIRDANVPLFLSNFMRFFQELKTKGEAVLTAQFSPNSNGKMREGTLLLSRTEGDEFDAGIYDKTSPEQLKTLMANLTIDADRFGVFTGLR